MLRNLLTKFFRISQTILRRKERSYSYVGNLICRTSSLLVELRVVCVCVGGGSFSCDFSKGDSVRPCLIAILRFLNFPREMKGNDPVVWKKDTLLAGHQ